MILYYTAQPEQFQMMDTNFAVHENSFRILHHSAISLGKFWHIHIDYTEKYYC